MEEIINILVVCRMISNLKTAVHYGASLARKFGASLTVIHVVHNPYGIEGWNLPLPDLEKDYQNLLEKSRQQVKAIVANESKDGLRIEVLIREGKPTEEILTVVKEKEIDLLVMLAHKEGRIEHFLFGRSNEELIRKMPCSILLIKKEPGPVLSL